MRRYIPAISAAAVLVAFMALFPETAPKAGSSLLVQLQTMGVVLPPIFLILGLLDVWVPRETLMKYMGPGSGVKGPIIGFIMGSAAAGPLYGAFPVASLLMKKGASFTNILIFIGAWSTTKIPMFLFEIEALGGRFALSRFAINLIGIATIALALKATIPKKEVQRVYEVASNPPRQHRGGRNQTSGDKSVTD